MFRQDRSVSPSLAVKEKSENSPIVDSSAISSNCTSEHLSKKKQSVWNIEEGFCSILYICVIQI
jgi:hypothetical protein